MKQILFAQPMIAEIVAMIRGERDHRRIEQSALCQKRHQHADLVVDLLDQAHIGRDDPARTASREKACETRSRHERAINRMRIVALMLGPHRRTTSSARYIA